MRTLFVDCSPKAKRSTSSYLLSHLSLSLAGEKERFKLLPKHYEAICEAMMSADAAILAMPIYVDGVPGSVLSFFEYVRQYILQAGMQPEQLSHVKIYAIVNCGFYEGSQTRLCHKIIENWCSRCGFSYMGGIGQGAGEMIGIIRYVNPALAVLISLVQLVIQAVLMGSEFSFWEACRSALAVNILVNMGLFFVFNLFMYRAIGRLARAVRQRKECPVLFSTVFCPRFLFVLFADIFWIVKALFRGVPFWKLW